MPRDSPSWISAKIAVHGKTQPNGTPAKTRVPAMPTSSITRSEIGGLR
jgi:hypothetical protein